MQEGINDVWVDIPDLYIDLDEETGADALQHFEFGNKDVRLVFDFRTGADEDIDGDVDADEADITCIVTGYLLAKMR
jgi:hypothetical protein